MTDPKTVAQQLLTDEGPPEAWQHATREAIDAHLRRDAVASVHWAAVQEHLRTIAPSPGAGDLDVYASARSLILERGSQEAVQHAMQQADEVPDADLRTQAYWLRVPDAVTALSKNYGTRHT